MKALIVALLASTVLGVGLVAEGCSSSSSGGSTSSSSSSSSGAASSTSSSSGGSSSSSSSSSGTASSSSSSSSSSSGSSGDAGNDGGKLPFGSPCTDNAECEGNVCALFQGKGGKFCTENCPANPADCPNGGQGCNGMGYCKVP